MAPFLYDVKSINKKIECLERQICELKELIPDPVPDPTPDVDFPRVDNYSALPDPALHTDEYYHVLSSQGDRWIPGWLGGANFYGKGFYYSDGATWMLAGDIPYQANQVETDLGSAMDKFITPGTLSAASTVSHPGHTHSATEIGSGSVDDTEFGYLDGVNDNIQIQINNINSDSIAMAVAL